MKVRLNLATHPLENHRRFLLGACVAGAVGLALFFFLTRQSYRDWRESSDIRARAGALQNQMRELRDERTRLEKVFKDPETRRTLDRAAFLNGLIMQRSFPWTQVFTDLEHILPEGVRVINIAPQMKDGRVQVKMTVGALSDDAKLDFLRTLEGAKQFTGVQVLSENQSTRTDQADRVVLEMVAWYSTSDE